MLFRPVIRTIRLRRASRRAEDPPATDEEQRTAPPAQHKGVITPPPVGDEGIYTNPEAGHEKEGIPPLAVQEKIRTSSRDKCLTPFVEMPAPVR